MAGRKIYEVNLSVEEKSQLLKLTKKGKSQARVLKRANILLLADEGMIDKEIAKALHVGVQTAFNIRKRFCLQGLQAALKEKPRPGSGNKVLDAKSEAYLVALTCSQPPEEREVWTMQLLADRLVELKVVESISDETVRRTLKKMNLSPGKRSAGALLR